MNTKHLLTSFEPVAATNAKVLILGTMPSIKSFASAEYYGNKQNAFWTILFAVLNVPFSTDYQVKMELIATHHIALWDVLQSCLRKSSLDSDIQAEVPNDIEALIAHNPSIRTIVFSSQKAAYYFKKHIGSIDAITFVTMPSPSGANARMPVQEKIEKWNQIKEWL